MATFFMSLTALPLALAFLGQANASAVPVRVGAEVEEPRKSEHAAPKYPTDARCAGLSGKVVVECVVDPMGKVAETTVLEGVPPLTSSAVEAIEKHLAPKYPAGARRAGLAGKVVVECVIDPKGKVTETTVLEGVPPLTSAAVEAIERRRYEPALLNGVPVPVIMTVTVNFRLGELKYYGLLGSLDDENEHLRASAARWLGHLKSGQGISEGNIRKAIEALEPMAESDESPEARAAAARSLSRLDGRPMPEGLDAADPVEGPSLRPLAWGTLVDPLGQSEIREFEDGFTIRVPPGLYDLSVEMGRATAPRVLRAVEGDFIAEVDVGRVAEAGGRLNPLQGRGFHGAGLLLWVDANDYVRLEAATYGGGTGPEIHHRLVRRYALFEERADGELVGGQDPAHFGLKDAPTSLRLERHGSELRALARQGAEGWREVGRMEIELPRTLNIGVAAVNTAESSLAATFRNFRVSPED
jgi:TonB family protein